MSGSRRNGCGDTPAGFRTKAEPPPPVGDGGRTAASPLIGGAAEMLRAESATSPPFGPFGMGCPFAMGGPLGICAEGGQRFGARKRCGLLARGGKKAGG